MFNKHIAILGAGSMGTALGKMLGENGYQVVLWAYEEEVAKEHHAPAPIFRPGTADLNTTLALALISVIMTQVFGLAAQIYSATERRGNVRDRRKNS